ncbi:MAG: hypothetical protein IKU03_01705 [Bacteroidales bacterium]|nr:hypothetical protein [Bacteroidales bacterium]
MPNTYINMAGFGIDKPEMAKRKIEKAKEHLPEIIQNITLEDGRPKWHGNCTNCDACFHHCPKKAIQYGKASKGKGQYYFGKL